MSKIIKGMAKLPDYNMDKKNILKFFVARGATIYTALSTCLIVASMLLAEDASVKILVPKQFLFLLLFSFVLALGSAIMKIQSLSGVLTRILHAVCFIGGFIIFLVLCGVNFAPLVIATAVFALIYIAVALISVRKNRVSSSTPTTEKLQRPVGKKAKKTEYTPMFRSDSNTQKDDNK